MTTTIRSIVTAALLTATLAVSAQASYPRKDYTWSERPYTTPELSAEEQKQPAVVLLDNRYFDYTENNELGYDLYVTKHKVVKVNDDKGIDRFNKVYIPMEEG